MLTHAQARVVPRMVEFPINNQRRSILIVIIRLQAKSRLGNGCFPDPFCESLLLTAPTRGRFS
jgi:hypothetical protein